MTFHQINSRLGLIRYQILHNVERIPQPEGNAQFNPTKGGDCFLCSSYAIIKHFCQQKEVIPPSMEDVYRKVWCHDDIKAPSGPCHPVTRGFWEGLNFALEWYELKLDLVEDPPLHEIDTFGPKLFNREAFKNRIQTYLEAGYLIHVEIQAKPMSECIKDGDNHFGAGDHLVVIDGFRITEDQKLNCVNGRINWHGKILYSVHVVDSNRKKCEPYWIDLDTWIEEHGGFNMYFLRPSLEKSFGFQAKPKGCLEHPLKDLI